MIPRAPEADGQWPTWREIAQELLVACAAAGAVYMLAELIAHTWEPFA